MSDDGGPVRLGAAVRERRAHLRLSQAELAAAAGISTAALSRIERDAAGQIRPSTRSGLEHALLWVDGLVDRILDGTATERELSTTVARVGQAVETSAAMQFGGRLDTEMTATSAPAAPGPGATAAELAERWRPWVPEPGPGMPIGKVVDALRIAVGFGFLVDSPNEATARGRKEAEEALRLFEAEQARREKDAAEGSPS